MGSGLNPKAVKSLNRRLVLGHLRREQRLSRIQLSDMTMLSPAAITNIVAELIQDGVVTEAGPESREQLGRPRMTLQLEASSRYVLALHIGVGQYQCAAANLQGELVVQESHDFDTQLTSDDVLADIATRLSTLMSELQRPILGLAVGALGLVNPDTGVNIFAPNLGWHQVEIASWLEAALGIPVQVENNVRLMAFAKLMNSHNYGQDLVYVQVGQGVGAGLISNGQMIHGKLFSAGEIGHTKMLIEGGMSCSCGGQGCLETLVAVPYLLKTARQLTQVASFEALLAEARAGNSALQGILTQSATYLGIALANVVNTLSPNSIVLGGIYRDAHDILLAPLEQALRARILSDIADNVHIHIDTDSHPDLTGAAHYALDQFFYHWTHPLTTA
ncbi:MAG: ROK family transcriptional regulator [Deinococcota bacterium]